ncbi:hypothetical protein FS837_007046 [Tulasnella sp. UAMH 9824]|nr:hypothetical protein FS837_007046 [Tulasnella sp. UAMH 9824]
MASDSEQFRKPDNTELVGKLVWESDEPLGRGGFAKVYAGSWRSPDGRSIASVAIKVLRPPAELVNQDPNVLRNALAELVQREADIWGHVEHPNITPLIGYCTDFKPSLLSPLYRNGDFSTFLDERPDTSSGAKLSLIRQTAEAVAYLHGSQPPICHGDIKPSNVLIGDQEEARLSDFGSSSFISEDVDPHITHHYQGGTKGFQAPELLYGSSCSLETDVFAFGCFIVAVFCGTTPFKGINEAWSVKLLACGNPLAEEVYGTLPQPLRPLVMKCIALDPVERPVMTDLVAELARVQL